MFHRDSAQQKKKKKKQSISPTALTYYYFSSKTLELRSWTKVSTHMEYLNLPRDFQLLKDDQGYPIKFPMFVVLMKICVLK